MLHILYIAFFLSLFIPSITLPPSKLPPLLNPAAITDVATPSPTVLKVEATSSPSASPEIIAKVKAPDKPTKVLSAVAIKKADSSKIIESSPKSAQSIFEALNSYRQKNGAGSLSWSNSLSDYARSRVDHFVEISSIDNHEGFKNFIQNEDGFNNLGFMSLGENSGNGNFESGEDLIERFYASHGPHNENQLDPKWSHVGVAVSGNFTDFIFAGNKTN